MKSFSLSRRSVLMPMALTGCWLFWMTAGALVWVMKSKSPANLTVIARYTLSDGIIGLLVCGLLFFVYERLRRHLGFRPFVFMAIPLSASFATIWQVLSSLFQWAVGWEKTLYLGWKNLVIGGALSDGTTLVLFSVLFVAVDHWLQLSEQREKAREATTLAHQAQLQMLRYQLNPHFLFNALNSIRAMIVENPTGARQIVTELAEFLRYSLNGRGHESTIGEEVQAIENYLAIQRIRFEEKLDARMQIDPAAADVVVPCFLIHPLVENAVKYGMETSTPPLQVLVAVQIEGDDLRVEVANSGRLLPEKPASGSTSPRNGTGTGLKNVRQRLELAFPDQHSFDLAEVNGRVRATIVLKDVQHTEPS